MNFGIALGGNKRNFPWDNILASANTAGDLNYAGHIPERHFVIPREFDGTSFEVREWLRMETPTGNVVANDTLDLIYINEGSQVRTVVVHNKKVAPGTTVSFRFVNNTTGAPIGAAIPVDLAVLGYTGLGVADLKLPIPANASLRMTLVGGDLRTSCFGVFVELVDFKSRKDCGCMPLDCDVPPLPTPNCFSATGV
jgi:hypothetical protein